MACPAALQASVVALARDICPFPDYTPHPHFDRFLSVNSSANLLDHYASVQDTLRGAQRPEFARRLRTTFGREGKVTMGGVGVVALSLAVLFDTLAKQTAGQWGPDTGPIRGLFKKELGGRYHAMVPVVSEYLRLVPHISNNPTRMREESERYYRQLHHLRLDRDRKERFSDLEAVNAILAGKFTDHLRVHLLRLTNETEVQAIERSVFRDKFGFVEGEGGARRRRQPELRYLYSLNCDAEAASTVFLEELDKLIQTNEDYKRCKPQQDQLRAPTVLHHVASTAVRNVIQAELRGLYPHEEELKAQRGDFDLKANWKVDDWV